MQVLEFLNRLEKLEKTIEVLKEKFSLSLHYDELHFDFGNYDTREVNDYGEELFYKLNKEESELLTEVLSNQQNMELITSRGTFKGIEFETEEEARKAGYGYYFTQQEYDIYILHTGKYTCEFGFVKNN